MAAADDEPLIDTSKPSAVRVRDYLLGGNGAYAADRELADLLLSADKGYPGLAVLLRQGRDFAVKASRRLAALNGISQFLVTGAGLPREPYLHGEVRKADPEARVVYADSDPLALARLRAAAGEWGEGVAVAEGDAADPAGLLAAAEASGVINLSEPLAVVLGGVLSKMPADAARSAVTALMSPLVSGSAAVISAISYRDEALAARMAGMFAAAGGGTWHNHSMADVASFFGGLRIARERVADIRTWPMLPEETPDVAAVGGVGIKGA